MAVKVRPASDGHTVVEVRIVPGPWGHLLEKASPCEIMKRIDHVAPGDVLLPEVGAHELDLTVDGSSPLISESERRLVTDDLMRVPDDGKDQEDELRVDTHVSHCRSDDGAEGTQMLGSEDEANAAARAIVGVALVDWEPSGSTASSPTSCRTS